MSPARQIAILARSFELDRAAQFVLHQHPQHQLAWAARGVLSVCDAQGTWVLPPNRALWIPAATPHVTTATTAVSLHSLYVWPDACPIAWRRSTVVAVGGLLRELILHLARENIDGTGRRRAEAVLYDLLEPVEMATIGVEMPADGRARRVADLLIADPTDARPLAAWAGTAGASERTLARAFAATGLAFGEWRTRVRLQASLPLLARGLPVGAVARRVGYATPSAFVAAFHRTVGVTPGEYFGGPA